MNTMLTKQTKLTKSFLWIFILLLSLSACSKAATPEVVETILPEAATVTPTLAEPTATPIPAAAIVNGEPVPLNWFEGELARYLQAQEAMGLTVESDSAARDVVLNDLIDQVLLAQAAREEGAVISDQAVQDRLDVLASEVDLAAWMAEWGYSEADLFQSLKLQLLAGFQREKIAESVPSEMEQVELRQIFAYTEEGAKRAMVGLNSGRDFEEVAFEYDPVTGGYLGWIPQGYLLIPAVEEAAFSLALEEHSEIIESEIGYHIVTVLSREERSLSADARLTLQRVALHNWIEQTRAKSEIQVVID